MLYQFGSFSLDTARRELRRGDVLVGVEPQVFDLLSYLIAMRDRVVSRDDLFAAVWQGRIVSEATLSSRLNAARTAIGDTGSEQRLIRTLPRKGIRFVGDVRAVAEPEAGPAMIEALADVTAPHAGPRLPSVAVLPFANLSGDQEQDYFADGMTEEIITTLSHSSSLFVIARNSSFVYRGKAIDVRQAGRELGVTYVLEGSVRRGREGLRITCQLVDAVSGVHLWSDRFDGDVRDVFALQEQVAESVAAVIEPTLQFAEIGKLTRDLPQRLDAYDLVLRAYGQLAEFTPTSMEAALATLEQSRAVDPSYAPSMAALAYCRAQCHFQGWIAQDEATLAATCNLAWQAVERTPNDAQTLWMAAFAIWNMAGSGREPARELLRRSLLLNPNSAMALTVAGWIEIMCGNVHEGRAMVVRAQRLNPRDPRGWFISGAMAIAAVIEENYPEALLWAERSLAQNRRFAVALRVLAVAHMKLDQEEPARAAVRRLLAIEPGLTVSAFFARIPVPHPGMAKTYADALGAAGLPP
ncbi:MAG TPA: winged helix-turn-helix domain-containing protein [Acidisoma sp.]|uniref:winged helix-turn-helix domain-containing protein n=1 Tax=Acidisoma sp. TaxID=1872115 RepID=UPI002BB300C3|nr:winged helix-turn-helix domain-containing protein [Acidisoma sp.]HTI01710.1 winged helix-turn-helix domain-containing protein [Acidisoma sp.]